MRGHLENEIEKWYKVYELAHGIKVQERDSEKKEWDLRAYAKVILENGRIDEQRQILAHLGSRLVVKNKRVYIDRVEDIK